MKFSLDNKSLGIAGLKGGRQATRLKGLMLAIGGVLFIAANFVTVKYILSAYNVFTFLPLWFAVALLVATVAAMVSRPPWQAQLRRNFWRLSGVGLTNGVAAALIFGALKYLDPSVTAFLGRGGTLYSVIFGYVLLGERFSRRCAAGMGLVLLGVGIITYGSARAQLVGIVLVLVGYVFTSLSYLLGKKVTKSTNPIVLIWMRSAGSLAVAMAVAAFSGRFQWHLSVPHLAVLVGGAVLGPFLGQMLCLYSMRYIGLAEMEMGRATQPLFVLIYSLVFLGMLPTLRQGLGGVVVVMGVLLLVGGHSVERTNISATLLRQSNHVDKQQAQPEIDK